MDLNFGQEEIYDVAKKILEINAGQKVFAIHGEMGSGKTTLIHALCEVLGVKDIITSPTFSIINQYMTPGGETIYHMDLYRLKDEEEAINAGMEDCLFSGNTCFVEWPERAPGIFPEDTLHVNLTTMNSNTRKLQINL